MLPIRVNRSVKIHPHAQPHSKITSKWPSWLSKLMAIMKSASSSSCSTSWSSMLTRIPFLVRFSTLFKKQKKIIVLIVKPIHGTDKKVNIQDFLQTVLNASNKLYWVSQRHQSMQANHFCVSEGCYCADHSRWHLHNAISIVRSTVRKCHLEWSAQ